MKINSIKLINFRQYKNVKLDFAFDPQKNVTVILGDNGFGKTTLVRSFLWCLYRENAFKDKILLNKEVAMKMEPTDEKPVKVELEIEHNNIIYTIITQENYKRNFDIDGNPLLDEHNNPVLTISKKAFTKMTITVDGQTTPINAQKIKEEIEKILRKELSAFLFYDGENNKIENSTHAKKIDSAVYEFMGIQKIMNLQTQFDPNTKNSVIWKLRNSLNSSDELKISTLREDKNEEEKKKITNETRISENEEEIEKLRTQLIEKEQILDANKDVYEDQMEKRSLDKEIKTKQASVEEKMFSVIEINNGKSNSMLKSLFAYCYEKNDLKSLHSKTSFTSEKSLSHISEEVVDEIIKRGYCLCGTEITTNSDAYNHLLESKNHMEPHDFGKYLSDFCSAEETNITLSKSSDNDVKKMCDKFLTHIEEIEDAKERLTTLKQKIEGRPDIGLVQTQANQLTRQISRLESTNKYIEENVITDLKKNIDKIDKLIEEASDDNEENRLINKCITYSKAIYNRTNMKIIKSKKALRETLERNTNVIFQSMYHGEREIKLNNKFQMITLVNNQSIDNSTGIETVKNFAFVTALMKTLKEMIFGIDDSKDQQNESYPLVIDAPFSNTDPTHIENICATLPKYCDQLIIVVMKRDFEIARNSLSDRIHSIYEIVKHTETFDTIEEMK